ncbi:MAG: hypothetical protein DYG94_13660 [Leptolyngbya sp. PLA3]|nr:MAG: hypothetical protein EDM82_14215 [Cyanobacteria bacterium CYA]MCE7969773.1 hypothetical protein [Leptolyngbya sp. PL-A3]
MGPREILLSAFIPGLAAAVLLAPPAFFMRRRERQAERQSSPSSAQWCGSRLLGALLVLLLVAGTLLGSYAWQTRLDLWPKQAQYRFPLVALAAGLLGLAPALLPNFRRLALLAPLAALAGGFVAWIFLSLLHESLISVPMRWTWIVVSALLTALHAVTLVRVADRLPGWRSPLLLSALAGTVALGATMSFANAPLVLGPAAAVAGGALLAAIIHPRAAFTCGAAASVALLIGGTLVFANWFGDRERWLMYALLAGTPLATALALLPPISRRGPTIRLLAAALPALALGGVQAARAIPPLIESMTQPAGTYDY